MDKGFPTCHINQDRLRTGPVDWSGELPEPAAWDLRDVHFLGGPQLTYRAEAAGRGAVTVHGRLAANVSVRCRRCLRDMETSIGIELNLRYEPAVRAGEEEEGIFGLDPNDASLDIWPAVREELLLALPDYPVCREDCKGLCPRCGGDRNEVECGCAEAWVDPRWNVLKEMVPGSRPGASTPGEKDDGNEG